jgi:hypothetical protein
MNRQCSAGPSDFKSYNNCINRTLTNLVVYEKIGAGTFGTVYGGTATYDGQLLNICIKTIKKSVHESQLDTEISDNDREVSYSYQMGKDGIGPIVYDAFYYVESIGTGKKVTITQVIIQELMDIDGLKFISNREVSHDQKVLLVQKMISLVRIQVYESGLYCTDIKAENYMVNVKRSKDSMGRPIRTNQISEVKMIDFGSDWCSNDISLVLPKVIKKDVFFLMNLILLHTLLLGIVCRGYVDESILDVFDNQRIWTNKKRLMFYIDSVYNSRFITFPFYFRNRYAKVCNPRGCYKTGIWDFRNHEGYDNSRDDDTSTCLFESLDLDILECYYIAENDQALLRPLGIPDVYTTRDTKQIVLDVCNKKDFRYNFATTCSIVDLLGIYDPETGYDTDSSGYIEDSDFDMSILSALYIANVFGQYSIPIEKFIDVFGLGPHKDEFIAITVKMVSDIEKTMFCVSINVYRIFNIYLSIYPGLHKLKHKIINVLDKIIIRWPSCGSCAGGAFKSSLILEAVIHKFGVKIKNKYSESEIKKCYTKIFEDPI